MQKLDKSRASQRAIVRSSKEVLNIIACRRSVGAPPQSGGGSLQEASVAINVSLVNYTDQGIRNIKDSPQRARAFRELCKQQGVQVREILWTSGPYDMVVITEGPEEALSSVLLSLAKLG